MALQLKASPSYYEHVIINFLDHNSFNTLYDIGVGPKTEYLTFAKYFPNVKFYGLEANPNTYKEVLPKFPGTLLPKAVSLSGGPVEFVVHEQNVMASGLIPYDNAAGGEVILVPSITLDDFDRQFNSPNDILLWMDIEGYELNALKSGRHLLSSGRIKLMNLEVRPKWNHKLEACTEAEIDEFLGEFGYEKIFVYNHYIQSRHHDAVYKLGGHELPPTAKKFTELYQNAMASMKTPDSILDLALGTIDCAIALEERENKIAYLRGKLSETQA